MNIQGNKGEGVLQKGAALIFIVEKKRGHRKTIK